LALAILAVAAVSRAPAAPADSLLWLQHLVQVAFPELKGRECQFSLTIAGDLDHDWSGAGLVLLKVYEAESARRVAPILEGRFNAIPGYESVYLHGELLSSSAMDAAIREAESHPEWTDADLRSLLERGGAEFPGVRDSFMRHLNIDRFAPLLGTINRVDVDFLWRGPRGVPQPQELVAMHWVVRVHTGDGGPRSRRYLLTFEPMHGRLISLVADGAK
jgi:hypothetical protein